MGHQRALRVKTSLRHPLLVSSIFQYFSQARSAALSMSVYEAMLYTGGKELCVPVFQRILNDFMLWKISKSEK